MTPYFPNNQVFSIAQMKDDESNDCLEDHLPGLVSSSPPRHQAPVCNTQKKADCTYFTHFTYVPQPGVGWGGVGGGVGCNDMHCHAHNCTCAHVGCYAIALAHMFDATQLHLRTCSMLRNCTCAHVGCYAIALAHMLDATQLHFSERGSSNGHGVLNSCVLTRICPSSSSSNT